MRMLRRRPPGPPLRRPASLAGRVAAGSLGRLLGHGCRGDGAGAAVGGGRVEPDRDAVADGKIGRFAGDRLEHLGGSGELDLQLTGAGRHREHVAAAGGDVALHRRATSRPLGLATLGLATLAAARKALAATGSLQVAPRQLALLGQLERLGQGRRPRRRRRPAQEESAGGANDQAEHAGHQPVAPWGATATTVVHRDAGGVGAGRILLHCLLLSVGWRGGQAAAASRPASSTRRRWARLATTGSWVIIRTVVPARCRAANSSSTSAPERLSRLPVGSSASSSAGSPTSARAIATRCNWPPESSVGS